MTTIATPPILNPKPQVVVRLGYLDKKWYVCHARSYQNAIVSKVNGKPTRKEAEMLAGEYGFEVVLHLHDPAQFDDSEGD